MIAGKGCKIVGFSCVPKLGKDRTIEIKHPVRLTCYARFARKERDLIVVLGGAKR